MPPPSELSRLYQALSGELNSVAQPLDSVCQPTDGRRKTAASHLSHNDKLLQDKNGPLAESAVPRLQPPDRETFGDWGCRANARIEDEADINRVSDPAQIPPLDMPPVSRLADGPTETVAMDDARSATPPAVEWSLSAQHCYQLGREVGTGSFGRVCVARDVQCDRDVAIKRLASAAAGSTDWVERFLFEAQITARLEHPGIVPVHAIGLTPEGEPFYAMKLIQGKTLWDLIREYHALGKHDPQRTVKYHAMLGVLVDVCNATAFAHSRGVIHRDIKPQNIMVGEYGETLLVDWGLSRKYGEMPWERQPERAAEQPRLLRRGAETLDSATTLRRERTNEGAVIGTPAFMPPEQARGVVDSLDHRADIFSLGATMYAVLAGQPPYTAGDENLLERVRLGQFARPRDINPKVPRPLEAICLKAMALAPEERYDSAKEIAGEISRWQSGEPVQAYAAPWWERAGRWARRHRTLCASVAASVAVFALLLGLWCAQRSARVRAVEGEARVLLQQGQHALAGNRLHLAAEKLDQARGLARTESGLSDLRSEIRSWSEETKRRLAAREKRGSAQRKLGEFRRLFDEAVVCGMLTEGVDIAQNARAAKEAATTALALFAVQPGVDSDPVLDRDCYSEQEIREIASACHQLRWVYIDALAHPMPDHSVEQDRAAAREALRLLDHMSVERKSLQTYSFRRAGYLSQAGDAAAAKAALEQALAVTPKCAEDHFLVGDFFYRNENYTAAARGFEQALRQDPDHFWANYFLGACLARLGSWKEALVALIATAHRRSDLIHVYLLRGFVYGELGELETAEADFRRAAAIDDESYGLYLNRGVVRLRHGRLDSAVSDFQTAVSLRPDAVQAYLNLAEAHRVRGNYEEALGIVQRALEIAPHSARPYRARAKIHQEYGDCSSALEDLESATERAIPGSHLCAALHAQRGRLLHQQARLEEALEAYDRALRERPDYFDALRLRALALVDLGRDKEALPWFDKYLVEGPLPAAVRSANGVPCGQTVSNSGCEAGEKDRLLFEAKDGSRRHLATVYRDRGLARIMVGDTAGAMQDFSKATELAPSAGAFPSTRDRDRFGTMYSRRGWAYLNHAAELAFDDFNAGIKIAPDSGEPFVGRGYARLVLGQYREAVTDAEIALCLGPENPGLYFNAACILAQSAVQAREDEEADICEDGVAKRIARAIELLRQCLQRWPDKREFYLRRAFEDAALEPLRNCNAFKQLLGTI
jgi:serine/threonine protein kinase/Tfp pilus assembly protein PilF